VSTDAGARERILHATLELIGEHGVGGVTNRAVAGRAGVSLGSLTYHFASQTDLLREALLRFVTREADRLEALGDGLGDGDVPELEEVAAAVQQVVQSADRREVLAQLELYLHASRDPALREVAARAYAAYDRAARTVLTALGVPDPEPLVPAVIALVDGFELRRLALDAPPGAADPALVDGLASLVRAARGARA
jgi:TetR/AcrR family transcriptional regulator, regulator of biofilm formation and stress response